MYLDYYKRLEYKVAKQLFNIDVSQNFTFNNEDFIIEYEKYVLIGEIKTRNFASTFYNSLFLEKKKYLALQNLALTFNKPVRIIYVNLFIDNIILIWNITNIKDEVFTIPMYNHTAIDIKSKKFKIPKDVYLLPLKNVKYKTFFKNI